MIDFFDNLNYYVRKPNIQYKITERRMEMKKIEAIIRPEVFSDVRRALALEGIDGLTVTEIAGCGRQEGRTGLFRGNLYEMEFSAKLKLEMIIIVRIIPSNAKL